MGDKLNGGTKNKIHILFFLLYILITLFYFWFRFVNLSTHYSMPDVDSDGSLWQYAVNFFKYSTIPNLDVNNMIAYPFGFNFQNLPVYSSIYELGYRIFLLFGGTRSSLLTMFNLRALIGYPLAGFFTYLISFRFTKNHLASFLGGLIFAFSFHNVLYARNSLSLNRFWLIPAYFLTLINFIQTKKFKDLLFSAMICGLVFGANAYRSFYSLVFSPILFFLVPDSLWSKIKNGLAYYFITMLCIIGLNINFFLGQVGIQFNRTNIEIAGRGFVASQQVTTLGSMFTRGYLQPTNERFIQYGVWLGFVGLGLLLCSLLNLNKLKQNYIYLVFLFAFFTALILSVNIPGLFGINKIFLNIFPMFKSISRMNIYASLFLGIIGSITYSSFIFHRFSFFKNILIVFSLIVILLCDSYPQGSATRHHLTDFQKIEKIYNPIKNDSSIRIIAGYPMTLYGSANSNGGVPPTYEMLGQIVHQKKLVGGVDPFNRDAQIYSKKIQNILDYDSINELAKFGVDTIIIYNKLISDPQKVNFILKNDIRLERYGNFKQPIDDTGYVSNKDLSQDISVYRIRKNINQSWMDATIFSNTNIIYYKANPYTYYVKLRIQKDQNISLFLNKIYDMNRNIYPGNRDRNCGSKNHFLSGYLTINDNLNIKTIFWNSDQCDVKNSLFDLGIFSILNEKPLNIDHFKGNNIFNQRSLNLIQNHSLAIQSSFLEDGLRGGWIINNQDGTYTVNIVLYYGPQLYYILGFLISFLFLGMILVVLFILKYKYKNTEDDKSI